MKDIKKILVVFILSFFIFGARSYAEIVNKVEASGNERISLETIVIFGDIIIGKNYESSDINILIKKLYDEWNYMIRYLRNVIVAFYIILIALIRKFKINREVRT